MEQTKEVTVLDIIISLTKAIQKTPKKGKGEACFYLNDGTNTLWGAKYLLNQILRQYKIAPDHIFISVAADKLWNEVTDGKEEIKNYHYTMQVPVHRNCKLDLYKGASNTPEKGKPHKPNDKFQYRQVFHDEHIIPIEIIIEKLISLDNVNGDSVQEILNNIYMCRMLKRENAGLTHKRPFSVVKTIEEIYIPKGIEIVDWEKIKNKI